MVAQLNHYAAITLPPSAALRNTAAMYRNAAILAAVVLVYSAIAGRVARSWLGGPIPFVAAGIVVGPLMAALTVLLSVLADGANANPVIAKLALAGQHVSGRWRSPVP